MALTAGTRLGHYEVAALLGEGGMGQVWQATDTQLNRQVALKILPDAFAADPDRLARFQREAQVLASLNHPGIAAIYGIEEAEGTRALVLELVEGPTLADRIAKGPIPIDEALPIARQIAEALEAAHEAGVIHRDLKPANVKVKADGTVKVLDFGLAKALEADAGSDPAESPTLTAAATQQGVIMGTAAYMSPEQASGAVVDKRADIWSFGAVLFEMLTGRRAFDGETVSHVLAAVLKTEPDWDTLPAETPVAIHRLLRRCLAKERRSRVPDIGMARFEIDDARAAPNVEETSAVAVQVWQRPMPLAIGILALSIVAGIIAWGVMRPAPAPVSRSSVTIPPGQTLRTTGRDTDLAISPDGSRLVFVTAQRRLYVRAVDQLDAMRLTGIETPRNPFISPDGESVGIFDSTRALHRMSIRGGLPTQISTVDGNPRGATWGPDNTIVFATSGGDRGLWRVSAQGGGEPAVLTTPDPARGEQSHWWPEILPGGTHVLFTIIPQGGVENAQIALLSLEGGTYTVLLPGGSHARYVPTGHLVYGVNETLWAVGFDLDSLTVTSDPVRVVDDVRMKPSTGGANFSVARDGSLAYVRGHHGTEGLESLVWVDRTGGEEPLALQPGNYRNPRISPEGTRVALGVRDGSEDFSLVRAVRVGDIHIYDIPRNRLTQLTFTAEGECCPVWTPDGARVVFLSTRDGTPNLYVQAADGTGEADQITEGPAYKVPYDITADGMVVFWRGRPGAVPTIGGGASRRGDVYTVSLDGAASTSSPVIATEFGVTSPNLSAGSRWIAYVTTESGRREVRVHPFPDVAGGRWSITPAGDGGVFPIWAPNALELFYARGARDPREMWAVPVDTDPTFSPGNPEMIFSGDYGVGAAAAVGRNFDISPEDGRFLMIRRPPPDSTNEEPVPLELILVQNWHEELLERVPVD